MSDVWQIRSASGTTEHLSVPSAFAEMDRLVLAGAGGVTFERKTAKSGSREPAARPETPAVLAEGPDGQIRIQI